MSDAQVAQPELLVSEDAWAALQGAYDMHVHVAPDVIERRIDDIGLAKEFLGRGFRGFVLKSHYVPTTERASVVMKAVPEIAVYGSITLNHSIGGLNPVAVEIAGRGGCKIVWMPTVDAANETWGAEMATRLTFRSGQKSKRNWQPEVSCLLPSLCSTDAEGSVIRHWTVSS